MSNGSEGVAEFPIGYDGQSQADRDAAELTDPLIRQIHELREARRKERRALVHRINDYRAERDALAAQLDAMTVERAVHAQQPGRPVERLVGPWTPVEGNDE